MAAKTTRRKKRKPTPKQRREQALREARAKGVKPMTEADFDKFLDEVGDVWPEDENLEDFLAWLYKARRTGKYE